jgi:hypothetical protein
MNRLWQLRFDVALRLMSLRDPGQTVDDRAASEDRHLPLSGDNAMPLRIDKSLHSTVATSAERHDRV